MANAPLPKCRKNNLGVQCHRTVYVPRGGTPLPECVVHTKDSRRDADDFRATVRSDLIADDVERAVDDFTDVVFPEMSNLAGLLFRRRVRFDFARFNGDTSFFNTVFQNGASFMHSTFAGKSDFMGAKFRDDVSFEEATFFEQADFTLVKFSGPAYFVKSEFRRGASFRLAILEDVVVIDESNVGAKSPEDHGGSTELAILDMSEVRIRGTGGFHLVNVNNAVRPLCLKTLNSVLDGCRFEDVNWLQNRSRLVLYEETELAQGTGRHELVKISYDRLTALFDDTRSYDLAEECFIGAMEMTRRNPHTSWWHRGWLSAYRCVSSYGTSYGRALGFLLATVILFAVFYATPIAGLVTSDRPQGPVSGSLPVTTPWDRAVSGVLHSMQVSLFTRERSYQPTRSAGIVLTTIQPVPVAVFTALFLLALRRRFHRGH